ncbi:Protein grainyhead [Smittium mucronatum]|uniref:Protein grainyhead n=1 Tax=Smittium mucronatum TaxID=133383 RepID=A0A1R0GUR7_9FUNG|nr:Protein grainyhead [Smittium mucronatum]
MMGRYYKEQTGCSNNQNFIQEIQIPNSVSHIDPLECGSFCSSSIADQGFSQNYLIASYQANVQSGPRFNCYLNAQTAVSQSSSKKALTYLNKGQQYNIEINPKVPLDTEYEVSVVLTFSDEQQRRKVKQNWRFWLSQQQARNKAKSVELDVSKSFGILKYVPDNRVDRVVAIVNPRNGVRLSLKFGVLSTDFTQTKGVKGISMGIALLIKPLSSVQPEKECYYCQGAERKNKDDLKQIEKIIKKANQRPNSKISKEFKSCLPTVSRFTVLSNIEFTNEVQEYIENLYVDEVSLLSEVLYGNDIISNMPYLLDPGYGHRDSAASSEYGKSLSSTSQSNCTITKVVTIYDKNNNPNEIVVEGFDPTYIPKRQSNPPVLCLYIKFPNQFRFRAIYLEDLSGIEGGNSSHIR